MEVMQAFMMYSLILGTLSFFGLFLVLVVTWWIQVLKEEKRLK